MLIETIQNPHTTESNRGSYTRQHASEHGASLVEYALVMALIAVVAVVAVGLVGGSLNQSFDTSAAAFSPATETAVEYPTKTAGVDGKVNATFALVDGQVVLEETHGDGWKMTVVKDNGTRVNTRFKNTTTGEVIRVNGWVNKKGDLKTKVRIAG